MEVGHEEGMKIMPSMKGHEISCPGTKGIKFMPLGTIFVPSANPQNIDQRECATLKRTGISFKKVSLSNCSLRLLVSV